MAALLEEEEGLAEGVEDALEEGVVDTDEEEGLEVEVAVTESVDEEGTNAFWLSTMFSCAGAPAGGILAIIAL